MCGSNVALEILKISASIIGGGAMGAVITAFINNRKNRIQRIGKSVKVTDIFFPNPLMDPHITRITISGTTESYHYESLFLCHIEIENIGNKDFKSFDYGLTLPSNAKIVNVQTKTNDRHHEIIYTPSISFESNSDRIDINLTPFNRKDCYIMNLLITSDSPVVADQIHFSSKLPVKFIDVV